MDTQNEHKKNSKKSRPTNAQIVSVYQKKGCNKSATCVALDICRNTLDKWRKNSPKLNDMMTEAEEALLDFTESKLTEQIAEGNTTAIIFHLKTKGKKRGWIEGLEIEDKTEKMDLSALSNAELVAFSALMKKIKKSAKQE